MMSVQHETYSMPVPRTLSIICSSCNQPWEQQHRCPVPPEIDFARYTDEALERLAEHLALVLKGRKEHPLARETFGTGSTSSVSWNQEVTWPSGPFPPPSSA